MAHTRNGAGDPRVVRPPDVSRYAERTATGWQWVNGAGTTYSLWHHPRRGCWTAVTDRPGASRYTAERARPADAMAANGWPVEACATMRRTLRPLGLMR